MRDNSTFDCERKIFSKEDFEKGAELCTVDRAGHVVGSSTWLTGRLQKYVTFVWFAKCVLRTEREIGLHLFLYEFWWLNCPTQINWTN
jgi:hypothetical protein